MALCGLLLYAGTSSADIYPGLVAYYPFSGNANDESGNGHNGTVLGATLVMGRLGRADSAYSFDGNDYILVLDDGSFNVGAELTISLWIRFLSDPPCDRPTSFVTKSAVEPFGSNTGFVFPYIGFRDCSSFGLLVNTWGPYNWDFRRSFSYYSIPNPYTWHFYAATYDGIARRVYIDGALVSVDYQSGTILANSNNLTIGVQYGTSEYIHAEIDEVRIYKRALSDADIREIYEHDTAIDATVNIDPDTLNLSSEGTWITAYIELPGQFNVADIDRASITMSHINGVPLNAALPASGPSDIEDYNGNGIRDLMVKFDRQHLTSLLNAGEASLAVSGSLIDGTPFTGSDTIRIISKGRK